MEQKAEYIKYRCGIFNKKIKCDVIVIDNDIVRIYAKNKCITIPFKNLIEIGATNGNR